MLWKPIVVKHRERVLLFKGQRLSGILTPGVHRVPVTSTETVEIETHHLDDLVFRSAWTDHLLAEWPDITKRHFTVVETNSTQVGMVYVNGALFTVLVPQKRLLFWRDAARVTAEIVNVIGEAEQRSEKAEDNPLSGNSCSTAYTCV
jgi:hypothetical protein